MSNKKISDIILELQDQVLYLTKLVKNQDNNLKIIINKLNSSNPIATISQKIDIPIVENKETFSEKVRSKFVEGSEAIAMKAEHAKQQSSNFERMASNFGIDIDENIQEFGSKQVSVGPRGGTKSSIPLSEAKEFSGQTRGRRIDREVNNASINVTQVILGSDGKPVPLASVKITDKLGQTVKSSRSNTKGRWNIPLHPGEYNVQILKKSITNDNVKPVDIKFGLTVIDNGTGKMEISSPNMEG